MIVSLVALPNGAFVRPHPAVWRMVLGASIAYLHVLIFLLFQTADHIKQLLNFFGHETNGIDPLDDPNYASAEVCEFTWHNVSSRVDLFVVAHFLGWLVKAVMMRSTSLCWFISGLWEPSEIMFSTMLPNFAECRWDQLLLDFLVCNGLGIVVGTSLCKVLDLKTYKWESILHIKGCSAKAKRLALQFTPGSWTMVSWSPFDSPRRWVSFFVLTLSCLLVELNTFLLKHIFSLPSSNHLNFWRLVAWSAWGASALRQFYFYCTDSTCKRLGTQAWVAAAILSMELLISIKFGVHVFEHITTLKAIVSWLVAVSLSTVVASFLALVYQGDARARFKAFSEKGLRKVSAD